MEIYIANCNWVLWELSKPLDLDSLDLIILLTSLRASF